MWNCTNTNLNLKSGLKGNNRVYLLYTKARRSCYLTTTCVHICLTSILHDQWLRWWSNIEVWAGIRPRFISLKGNDLNVLVRLLALPEPNTGRFKPILLILFFNRVNVYFVDDSIRFRSELQEDKSMEPICCTRFLTRMGQVKIMISSHFVHTDRRTHTNGHTTMSQNFDIVPWWLSHGLILREKRGILHRFYIDLDRVPLVHTPIS